MLAVHISSGTLPNRARRGVGILDAVVGSVILLLIVVGVSTQLVASSLSIGTSQASFVATSIANSAVVRQQADNGYGTISAATTQSWTDANATQTTVGPVGGITFTRYVAGGWCALTGSGATASWGNYASAPVHPGYWISAKVTWGDGTTYRVISGQAPPPNGTNPPATSNGCPVTLP
jgi:hypothetical protein